MDLKDLNEKRKSAWEQAKGLVDTAISEKRELDASEQEQYDRINKDIDGLRARIDREVEQRQIDADVEASLRNSGVNPAGTPATDLSEQFRQLAKGEIRSIDMPAGDFGKALNVRALSKGTATAGGNTVPTSFYDQLVEHMVESSGVLQLGPTVLNTTGGEQLDIPVTTSYGAAALVAEAGTIAQSDPAFAKRSLGAYKYGQLVLASRELVDDSAFDLASFIAKVAGRNVGLALGAHLITGTGTAQPTGIVTSASTGVTGGTGVVGVPTADNLIDLMFSVIAPYRNSQSAGWLVKDSTLGAIRKIKDGSGRYLFEPAATFGTPDTLLGKPIQSDPNVAATALNAKSVIFGDMSAYFIRYAGGVRFDRSDDFKFDTDQVAFRCLVRADAITADQAGAIKVYAGGAS